MKVNNTLNMFDMVDDEEASKWKPLKSEDWKWTFADYPKEKNGLKVFSCFACGGGSTMGYKLAGCEVLGCCEIDKRMNDVYVKNHHPKYNYLMDIREFNKLPNDEIPDELFNLDILDGSPPCTTFSMAGDREESWGKLKKFREGQAEQTLDDLSFVFIETVKKLKPKVVIMENVEGLLLGEARTYVQQIYEDFKGAGYQLKHYLMKGENMGVPQSRHRVFFIAIRNDIPYDMDFLDLSFHYEIVPYGKIKDNQGKPCSEETLKLINEAREDENDLCAAWQRLYDPSGERRCRFSDKLCKNDRVLYTISAGHAELFDYENRTYISASDIISAQTFPQDYDFVNTSFSNINYICGMSVPPVMIKRIVTRLIERGVFEYKGIGR